MGQHPLSSPRLVCVAGPGSNSGKTTLMVAVIEHFVNRGLRVAAFKIASATPDHRCGRTGLPCGCLDFDGRYHVVRDPEVVRRPGKDSARFVAAGADPVWWLQATRESAKDALEAARAALPPCDVLVVEGSAPLRDGSANLGILMAPQDDDAAKPGYDALLPACDLLVYRSDFEAAPPATTEALRRGTPALPIDADGALDPAMIPLLDGVLGRASTGSSG